MCCKLPRPDFLSKENRPPPVCQDPLQYISFAVAELLDIGWFVLFLHKTRQIIRYIATVTRLRQQIKQTSKEGGGYKQTYII